jgi:hypothetical protein
MASRARKCGGCPGTPVPRSLAWPIAGRPFAVFRWLVATAARRGDADRRRRAQRLPQAVVDDLNNRYFPESAAHIGTEETNDFISGPLQNALRQALYDGITSGVITEAIPLSDLPDHPVLRQHPDADGTTLRQLLGNPAGTSGLSVQELCNLLKLEAPLAVQGQTLPGFIPFNKFSSIPLLMKAAAPPKPKPTTTTPASALWRAQLPRQPPAGPGRPGRGGGHQPGTVPVPANGKVVVALGTIESTRLALNSFAGQPGVENIGHNLMVHLRSNLTIRIPRASLAGLTGAPPNLQAAAPFAKCRHQFADNSFGYFHTQVTAAGLGALGTDSEAELFKLIPDVDTLHRFTSVSDTHIVITIRTVGEMQPQNAHCFVRLDPELDEFGVPRAFVQLQPTANDDELWLNMDTAADQAALVFAAGADYEVHVSRVRGRGGRPASIHR